MSKKLTLNSVQTNLLTIDDPIRIWLKSQSEEMSFLGSIIFIVKRHRRLLVYTIINKRRISIGMKHRSRTEIIGSILEAANGGGATKTTLMYKAVLSYDLMK